MNELNEAEMYCIGSAILHSLDRQTILQNLDSSDYLNESARDCHYLIERLQNESKPITMHIVALEANKRYPERFKDIVIWLEHAVLISHGVDSSYYVNIIKSHAIKRKSIKALIDAQNSLMDTHCDPLRVVENTFQSLNSITKQKTNNYQTVSSLIDDFENDLNYSDYIQDIVAKRANGEDIFPGLRTGYKNLDSIIGGFKKGSYNVIGARSTSGKTTLMINFMRNISMKYPDARQVFLTLEMPPKQIIHKLIGAYCSLNPKKIEQGDLTQEEVNRIIEMEKSLKKMDLILDGSIPANTSHIRSLTQRLAHEKGADIIFIDYLTRLKSINKYSNKHLEIDEISKSLQDIALTLNIPVVCLCQLNRQVLQRTHKEPLLSDIRESGSVEEDADVVILIHRPKLYDASITMDYTELHVAKNRQYGDLGKTRMEFNSGILTELPPIETLHPGNITCEKTVKYNYYE